jgi:hypothetical protein
MATQVKEKVKCYSTDNKTGIQELKLYKFTLKYQYYVCLMNSFAFRNTHPLILLRQILLSSFILLLVHAECYGRTQLPNYSASHPNKLWSETGDLFLNSRIQHTTNAWPSLLQVNLHRNTRKNVQLKHGFWVTASWRLQIVLEVFNLSLNAGYRTTR